LFGLFSFEYLRAGNLKIRDRNPPLKQIWRPGRGSLAQQEGMLASVTQQKGDTSKWKGFSSAILKKSKDDDEVRARRVCV
jgi:hypothetical protein